MRKPNLVIIVAAVVAALVAFYVLLGMLAPRPAPQHQVARAPEAPKVTEVLTTTRQLQRGEALGSDNAGWIQWPLANVQPAFITKAKEPNALKTLAGRRALVPMSAGLPVVETALAPAGVGFMSTLLSEGKRAVSVAVQTAHVAGGFIQPDDHVDVLVVEKGKTAQSGEAASVGRLLLSDIRVLAVDSSTQGPDDGKGLPSVSYVTLEVDDADITRVVTAESRGTIELALRAPSDRGVGTLKPVDDQAGAPATVRMVEFGQMRTLQP